eukprot:6207278-Pleurochrysis_carterae.AAC.1
MSAEAEKGVRVSDCPAAPRSRAETPHAAAARLACLAHTAVRPGQSLEGCLASANARGGRRLAEIASTQRRSRAAAHFAYMRAPGC